MGTYTVDWYELSRKFIAKVADKTEPCSYLRSIELDETWSGGSAKDAKNYILNGYDFGSVANLEFIAPTYDNRRWRFSDEPDGEFDYDRYMSGELECYLNRIERKDRRGLKVTVGYGFRANVPISTIADYGVWVGKLIAAIQAKGLDVEVLIESKSRGTYYDGDRIGTTQIRVSKFGEKIMLKDWSAIFSPIGFRGLVFFARKYLGEKHNVKARIGGSIHAGWKVTYDQHERAIHVDCESVPSGSGGFPVRDMDRQLDSVLREL